MTKKKEFSKYYSDPVWMALAVVGLLLLSQILFYFVRPLVPELMTEESPWVVSVAMMLFFILFNSISTFLDDRILHHWGRSIYGFFIIGLAGYLSARLVSGLSLDDIEGFRDIILIVIIGFLVLRTIATTIVLVIMYTKFRDARKRKRDEKRQVL